MTQPSVFPTVAQVSVQNFHRRRAGQCDVIPDVSQFVAASRSLEPRLTDKGACALYLIAHFPGISKQDIEYALVAQPNAAWAVLRGLAVDLKLAEVNSSGWVKTVRPTDAGMELARASLNH